MKIYSVIHSYDTFTDVYLTTRNEKLAYECLNTIKGINRGMNSEVVISETKSKMPTFYFCFYVDSDTNVVNDVEVSNRNFTYYWKPINRAHIKDLGCGAYQVKAKNLEEARQKVTARYGLVFEENVSG